MTTPRCRRCTQAEGQVTPYWATDDHRLCAACARWCAAELDRRNAWPPVPWEPNEVPIAGNEADR